MATIKVAQLSQKPQETSSYACHICGLNGHKIIECPKFVDMYKMFHWKFVAVEKVQPISKTQIITADVNVVDVNVTTRRKVTEEQVFKDREPIKANNVVD